MLVVYASFYVVFLILLISGAVPNGSASATQYSNGVKIFLLILAIMISVFSLNSLFINRKVCDLSQQQIVELRRLVKPKAAAKRAD